MYSGASARREKATGRPVSSTRETAGAVFGSASRSLGTRPVNVTQGSIPLRATKAFRRGVSVPEPIKVNWVSWRRFCFTM